MATHAPHKPQFYVDALRVAEADIAYPLVRSICPEVSLEQWLTYARRRCRDGGFRLLFDAGGTMVGLFGYRLSERLLHGRVLSIDDFVTFELNRSAPGRCALMAAAETLAQSLGCGGLEIRVDYRGLADTQSPRAGGWLAVGLALDSGIFVKPL